ncbi:hypothetical protein F503_02373 [Ophiostoma piceae UAMH 11346]|uniref:Duf1168 domain protein n=1 Tax=Ophiostoma piceae (strain UAMH 11346) TaxID=1262450 RepID=S3CZ90_OPHP1|nr:hypothetical protein F503_02373 [Ophiostoma piceae UAMH 11346]
MSGEGPESIPTSADRRSKRPVKKRALTPVSAQAAGLDALFSKPDQHIKVPISADVARLRDSAGAGTPEIISNVQGSSSGAGSGEFHVYKASRRREYARLRQLEEEAEKDKNSIDFVKAKQERETRDDEKTRRNREKREKAKARKAKGKKGGAGALSPASTPGSGATESAAEPATAGAARAPSKPVISRPEDSDDDKDNDGAAPSAKTNGASGHKTKAQEPMPVAEGPGLLIQDDDD